MCCANSATVGHSIFKNSDTLLLIGEVHLRIGYRFSISTGPGSKELSAIGSDPVFLYLGDFPVASFFPQKSYRVGVEAAVQHAGHASENAAGNLGRFRHKEANESTRMPARGQLDLPPSKLLG
jgi:hypothetical protein